MKLGAVNIYVSTLCQAGFHFPKFRPVNILSVYLQKSENSIDSDLIAGFSETCSGSTLLQSRIYQFNMEKCRKIKRNYTDKFF